MEDLWRTVLALSDAKLPVWSEEALEIALQVARGALKDELALRPSEEPQPYAERVLLAQQTYKTVPIFAADDRQFNIGFWQLQFEARQRFGSEKAFHKLVPRPEPRFEMHIRPFSEFDFARADAEAVPPPPTSLGPKLHQAFEDYITWIKQEYHRPALGRITDNAHTRIKQVRTLIDRHQNVCVSELDFEAVERMFGFWRRRPLKKGKKDQFVSLSCANKQLDELKRFFDWLHRSSKYDWRRPDDFDAIKKRAESLATDHDGGLQQVDTFSLKELVLLYQFASAAKPERNDPS